jgi:putative RecB family exonuclease
MQQFSHSKLQTYERCPLQYKFQYLTNLKPEQEDTIEAFVGSRVHETLELLYRDLLKTKLNSLVALLKFYDEIWRVEWTDEIVINDKNFNKKHYFNLGKKCIENYYKKYYPFDQDQTIGVEKKINLKWGDIELIGYIDRLARDKKGVYSIHDYKTGAIMEQKYADEDRQLALYSIAIKESFKEAKEVKLMWHFVAYGEDVISSRTDKELSGLKSKILALIEEINLAEKEDNFPAKENKCEWCGYWQYCPKKKHLFKVEKLPKNKYLKDSGVKLAKKYIELGQQKAEINKRVRTEVEVIKQEMEKIEEAILKYAEQHKVDVLEGGESLVAVNKKKDYSFPTKTADIEKYNELENLLKKSKYWSDVSSVNATKVSQLLEDNKIDNKLKMQIIALVPLEESISLSVRKK